MTDELDAPPRSGSLRSRYAAAVAPRADGLPRGAVVAVPLAILAAVFVALVALGITGSSTGIVHSLISSTSDPDLIFDEPQAIRSDEWLVQTTWTISQVEQGLPVRNEVFPGGMDATVQHDLPSLDWSTAFRPHLVGFLFLPLDHAMAVKWWLPGFSLIAAVYLFAVTLMPRRPMTAAALAVGFFFAPFFQWWYLSITLYPPAWAFLVMTAVVWSLRSVRRRGAWVLSGLAGYLTVAVGTGIYVPFIVPAALVALAVGVGAVMMPRSPEDRFGMRVRAVMPLLVCGAAAAAVMGVWIVTRWETIVGFASTVYPGERLQAPGSAGMSGMAALLSGPLSAGLEGSAGLPFGPNASEASTFLLPGLCLAVVLLWLIVRRARDGQGIDWLSIAVLAVGVVMAAFMFVRGWEGLAHLLFLDRTTYGRMRLGLGILSLVMIVLVSMRLTERTGQALRRIPPWVPLSALGLSLAATAFMLWSLARFSDASQYLSWLGGSGLVLVAVVTILQPVIVALFAWDKVAPAAVLLLVASILSSAGVNPLYRGVLDLRDTAAVAEIERLSADRPGQWVGINTTYLPTMLLVEAGVSSLNGMQGAPSPEMWGQIDPEHQYEDTWNRLANVGWIAGQGAPSPRNPVPDQIQMTFDSCDAFAQRNVAWVLSETLLEQECLSPVAETVDGPATMHFYEVVAPGGATTAR